MLESPATPNMNRHGGVGQDSSRDERHELGDRHSRRCPNGSAKKKKKRLQRRGGERPVGEGPTLRGLLAVRFGKPNGVDSPAVGGSNKQ